MSINQPATPATRAERLRSLRHHHLPTFTAISRKLGRRAASSARIAADDFARVYASFLGGGRHLKAFSPSGRSLLSLLSLAAVGSFLYTDIRRPVIIVHPFEVPSKFAEHHTSPRALSLRLLDHFHRIGREARSELSRTPDFLAAWEDTAFTMKSSGFEFSIRPILDHLEGLFGVRRPHILGEVEASDAEPTTGWRISVRFQDDTPFTVAVSEGNLQRAIETSAEYLYRDIAPYVLAAYYFRHKDFENSMAAARHCLRTGGVESRVWTYNLLARVLEIKGDRRGAVRMYKRCLAENGDFAPAYFGLGNFWLQKNPRFARYYYEAGLARDPASYTGLLNLGKAFEEETRFNDARRVYSRVIRLNPEFLSGYQTFARFCLRRGDELCAEELYEHAIDLSPDKSEPYIAWGRTLYSLGRVAEAEKKFRRGLRENASDRVAAALLSLALAKQGKCGEAKEMAELTLSAPYLTALRQRQLAEVLRDTPELTIYQAAELREVGRYVSSVEAVCNTATAGQGL